MTNLTDKIQDVTTRLDTIIEKLDEEGGEEGDELPTLTQIRNALRTVYYEDEYDDDGNIIGGAYPEEDENLGQTVRRISDNVGMSFDFLQQIRNLNENLLYPASATPNTAIRMLLAELATINTKIDAVEASNNQIFGILGVMATAINTMATNMRGIDKLVAQQQGALPLLKKIERNTAKMMDCCKTSALENSDEIIDDPDASEDSDIRWVRVTRFVIGDTFQEGGVSYTRVYPVFPGDPIVAHGTQVSPSGLWLPHILCREGVENPNFTIKWDFSASTVRPKGFAMGGSNDNPLTTPPYVNFGNQNYPAPNPIKNNIHGELTDAATKEKIYQTPLFVVTPGETLLPNVWIHYAFTPPTPAVVPGIKSTGITSASITGYIVLANIATWPATTGDPALVTSTNLVGNRTRIECANWENYRLYVESSASVFSVQPMSQQRFPTGEWITLSGSHTFEFAVLEDTNISVTIQPR